MKERLYLHISLQKIYRHQIIIRKTIQILLAKFESFPETSITLKKSSSKNIILTKHDPYFSKRNFIQFALHIIKFLINFPMDHPFNKYPRFSEKLPHTNLTPDTYTLVFRKV